MTRLLTRRRRCGKIYTGINRRPPAYRISKGGVTVTVTRYTLPAPLSRPVTVALATDLHGRDGDGVVREIGREGADLIAVAGDVAGKSDQGRNGPLSNSVSFLRNCSAIAPTFLSLGNHEADLSPAELDALLGSGATVLDNSFVRTGELTVGGLTSGYFNERPGRRLRETPAPDADFVRRLSREKGFRVLLCHHPEYYPGLLRDAGIDLILSGHAHGGQWRLFGRGLFAPGQGILPRYTSGVHDGRLVISRGLANTLFPVPRLFNPTELVFVRLEPDGS